MLVPLEVRRPDLKTRSVRRAYSLRKGGELGTTGKGHIPEVSLSGGFSSSDSC
jgi:hypothetical protein